MMTEEKQIEEIEAILLQMDNCENHEEIKCIHNCRKCYATQLYNADYRKLPDDIGEFSDGYHTFNELYHHRAVLFSVICNIMPEKAWKSKLHDTGDMFDGMFIVGIETEQGQATYHYDIEPYWDMFKVKELEKAPKWDGHTPTDAIQRIGNIKDYRKQSEKDSSKGCEYCKGRAYTKKPLTVITKYGRRIELVFEFCPNCGRKMKGGAK